MNLIQIKTMRLRFMKSDVTFSLSLSLVKIEVNVTEQVNYSANYSKTRKEQYQYTMISSS